VEGEKRFVEGELIRLQKELKRLKTELERLKAPPLIIGQIKDILADGRVVVRVHRPGFHRQHFGLCEPSICSWQVLGSH